mmetsp:Transcript_119301/g.167784  ORF Transcript_119301/g.167784 Transcript_119301/m.167784 type:complete len:84 (-) Transcript_119301:755-1006(-)
MILNTTSVNTHVNNAINIVNLLSFLIGGKNSFNFLFCGSSTFVCSVQLGFCYLKSCLCVLSGQFVLIDALLHRVCKVPRFADL